LISSLQKSNLTEAVTLLFGVHGNTTRETEMTSFRVPARGMSVQLPLLLSTLLVAETASRVIDLSHNHGPDTFMFPGTPHFNRTTLFSGDFLPGIYVESGQYFSGEHGGTHMDAPVHFSRGGQELHQVPLENTIAEGVMIDCTAEAARDRSYLVPVQKLLDWEKQYGRIPSNAAVLINFGWSNRFHNVELYLGGPIDDQSKHIFPAVSAEAGLWLYNYRNIKIIGTDTLSPDPLILNGKKVTIFPIHQKYLANNRLIIENVNALDKLPPKGFRFHSAPVKFVGNTGAQVRAYAMTFDEDLRYTSDGHQTAQTCFFVFLFVCGTKMLF
jgi:kynurenine formamidase